MTQCDFLNELVTERILSKVKTIVHTGFMVLHLEAPGKTSP